MQQQDANSPHMSSPSLLSDDDKYFLKNKIKQLMQSQQEQQQNQTDEETREKNVQILDMIMKEFASNEPTLTVNIKRMEKQKRMRAKKNGMVSPATIVQEIATTTPPKSIHVENVALENSITKQQDDEGKIEFSPATTHTSMELHVSSPTPSIPTTPFSILAISPNKQASSSPVKVTNTTATPPFQTMSQLLEQVQASAEECARSDHELERALANWNKVKEELHVCIQQLRQHAPSSIHNDNAVT